MTSASLRIDLHVHSTYSDGTDGPIEVLDRALRLGVAVVSLTDHDTVEGVRVARASSHPVRVIPGVELSAIEGDDTEIHILGYFMDIDDTSFLSTLKELAAARARRGAGIVDRVNGFLLRQGLPAIQYETIEEGSLDVVGRPHIARHLLEKGYVRSLEEAFARYLIPCNIPKKRITPEEAVEIIHQAGGLAVLAHPAKLQPPGGETLERYIYRLAAEGMDGVEVYYGWYTREETEGLRKIAENRGLLITGGSDYHGQNKSVELGQPPISVALLKPLESRLASRRAGSTRSLG